MGLLVPALAFAVADWVAVLRKNKRAEYLLKPAVMGALLVAAPLIGDDASRQLWFIMAALVFSLAGDVFLMLPRDLFLQGLGAFLVAHICYSIALFGVPEGGSAELIGPGIGVAAGGGAIYLRLLKGMRANEKTDFALPVLAYAIAISVMWLSAASTFGQTDFPKEVAWATYLGAALFVISDALIGYSRFVRPHRLAQLAIIVTYHLGQMGLVLSLAR